ncbi:MAG: UDP-3-O-(3-hydroxymyristoyl)glucosamine N-acyltransferase [Methylococcaceae bacterium]|nr:UDP-3-O-(3-hydroxymyristoyl)glucosamine N-acyltransferase [Methylococcaceae bacterium]
MSISLKELADLCNAKIEGGDPSEIITSAADVTSAQKGQVTQLTNAKYARYFKDSKASACFIAEGFKIDDIPATTALLICTDPEMSFLKAVELLHPTKEYSNLISPQAVIDETAKLGKNVFIGPFAVIGQNAEVGDFSAILPGAYIGNDVKIGQNCRIHPYAVIYDNAVIGNHVIVHSGAIIGADGFGYKFRNNAHVKVPQVGNVIIEDNVEIGANTCIDRGALGSTTIGLGSKIDNLVQIGHNNKIGNHVIMCGLTGVSGSCHIGDYAILAGSSGIADHVNIGQGAVVMARSGVAGNIEAGAHVFGSPAKDKKTAYKEQIALSKLPELIKKIKEIEERLSDLDY